MYPVLIKTASKNFILQTGKTVCASFLRYSSDISNEIELRKNDFNIRNIYLKDPDYIIDSKRNDILIFMHNDKRSCDLLPPEPTTCCMSGCSNCVWIEYAETVAKLMDGNCDQARQLILNKIEDPNLKMFLAIELKNIQYNLEQSRNTNVTEYDKDKEK